MNISNKTKILILSVTAVLAAAVIIWLVFLLGGRDAQTGDGYVGYVNSVTPANAMGEKDSNRYFITVRGDARAYVFEFNPDTKLYDTEGEQQTYYSLQVGQRVRVYYDEDKTADEPAQFIATKAEMIDEPRFQ